MRWILMIWRINLVAKKGTAQSQLRRMAELSLNEDLRRLTIRRNRDCAIQIIQYNQIVTLKPKSLLSLRAFQLFRRQTSQQTLLKLTYRNIFIPGQMPSRQTVSN